MAHWNPGSAPVQVSVAPPVGVTGTIRLVNEGASPCYVGGAAVTPASGLKLLAGTRAELAYVNSAYYACSGALATTTNTTVTTSATAGTLAFTVGSTTGFAPGTTVLVGNTSPEQLVVAATASSTVFTAATASLYDHMAGATVATATLAIAQLRCEPGVL